MSYKLQTTLILGDRIIIWACVYTISLMFRQPLAYWQTWRCSWCAVPTLQTACASHHVHDALLCAPQGVQCPPCRLPALHTTCMKLCFVLRRVCSVHLADCLHFTPHTWCFAVAPREEALYNLLCIHCYNFFHVVISSYIAYGLVGSYSITCFHTFSFLVLLQSFWYPFSFYQLFVVLRYCRLHEVSAHQNQIPAFETMFFVFFFFNFQNPSLIIPEDVEQFI
jgi:hypothetical protein